MQKTKPFEVKKSHMIKDTVHIRRDAQQNLESFKLLYLIMVNGITQ